MIISDTTPLSNLIQLDLLDLLRQLCGTITIPVAVANELDNGHEYVGDWRKACKDLIQIVSVEPDPLIEQFLLDLHHGEAEVLTLAIRRKAKLILCDDMDARKIANHQGLNVIGTLAILIKAKSMNMLPLVTPYLDKLRNEVRFWFTDELYHQIKSVVQESN